ncbi:MAG: hypothetical protein V1821_03290 [bacterium]
MGELLFFPVASQRPVRGAKVVTGASGSEVRMISSVEPRRRSQVELESVIGHREAEFSFGFGDDVYLDLPIQGLLSAAARTYVKEVDRSRELKLKLWCPKRRRVIDLVIQEIFQAETSGRVSLRVISLEGEEDFRKFLKTDGRDAEVEISLQTGKKPFFRVFDRVSVKSGGGLDLF